MLKKFFLNLLSSFMGAWIALGLFGFVAIIVIISLIGKAGMSSQTEKLTKHSILKISLDGVIEENETAMQVDVLSLAMNGNLERPQTLNVIVKAIEDAANNRDIDCIYLECGALSAGPSTLNAIRDALVKFKKEARNKKIMAYGPSLSQGCLYVASVADSVFVNPQGDIALMGISGATPYMKDLFDKLGIEFQVVKVGTFKSAVEPYIMQHMSEPAKAQLDTLYGYLWDSVKGSIAESRHIQPAVIDTLINKDVIYFNDIKLAKKHGLVDGIVYDREMQQKLAWLTNRSVEDLNFVSPYTLSGMSSLFENPTSKNQIAVFYCVGDISEEGTGGINCFDIVPELVKLADNDNVKGLVLRVNSPGGSVYGSEQIWEAVEYFKSKGKPVAVSMGDYAASGGYYISCGADRIFANPLTITGSIGIFGLMPNAEGLLNKIGVNFETTATNTNGAILIPYKPLNDAQLAAAQNMINRGYDQFCGRVAKGRNMSVEAVKRIAEGRVWSAQKAKEIGLVDELGQLEDAVKWVADKAEIADNYNLCGYPEVQSNIWAMIPQGIENSLVDKMFEREDLKPYAKYADFVKYVLARKPIQVHMQPIYVRL